MTYKISCPQCGHHIADVESANAAVGTVRELAQRTQFEQAGQVAEWLKCIPAGRYSPAELRESFLRECKVDMSAKGFGQALMAAGATPRRGTNGVRTWLVGSPD